MSVPIQIAINNLMNIQNTLETTVSWYNVLMIKVMATDRKIIAVKFILAE
jgi:hypothetical protein